MGVKSKVAAIINGHAINSKVDESGLKAFRYGLRFKTTPRDIIDQLCYYFIRYNVGCIYIAISKTDLQTEGCNN